LRTRLRPASFSLENQSYHFRVTQQEAKKKKQKLELAMAPLKAGQKAWWEDYYTVARKIHDRDLFA